MSAGFEPLVSESELDQILERLGEEISRDFPAGVLCIGVLKGSIVFLADLIRQMSIDCEIDFLALSAYRPGERRVRIVKDLETDVSGRDVVLVEDVVDTGLSAGYVLDLLDQRGVRQAKLCALIDRPTRRILPLVPDYIGRQVQEQFLVGYGLDIAERYRNLPALYSVGIDQVIAAPDWPWPRRGAFPEPGTQE